MTENTDNRVLMRCENCGYLEYVPETDLALLRDLSQDKDEEDHLLCPFCLNDMYRADSSRFSK